VILHQLFFEDALVRKRPTIVVQMHAEHQVTRLNSRLSIADDDRRPRHPNIPVSWRVIGGVLRNVFQDRAVRLFCFPERKAQLIRRNKRKPVARERARYSQPGDLLPIRARLLIAHKEVLIVDSRKMERECDAVYCSLEHQTGVTECSIRRDERDASQDIIDDVVIGHGADRVRARILTKLNGDNLLATIELRCGGG
jgi:hypothetical protein